MPLPAPSPRRDPDRPLVVRYEQTRQSCVLDKVSGVTHRRVGDSLHLPQLQGRIEFRDVHFAYPASPPLLKGLA